MVFRVNEPQVIHETIDGEVVIINLGTGNYYSLRDTGADVWGRLVGGETPEEVIAAYRRRHEALPGTIEEGVSGLVDELRAEGLIVDDDTTGVRPTRDGAGEETSDRSQFVAPVLEKFDDMQDLILLDPVHEVDEEAGWPKAKTTGRD